MNDEQRTIDALERGLPRVAPPADLFDRIQAEIHQSATVLPFRRRLTGNRVIAGAAFVAAAAAALVVVLVNAGEAGRSAATAVIRSHLAGTDVLGTAALYRPETAAGTLRLTLRSVPAPPHGRHYEVWVLERGQTSMMAVGSFTPASSTVKLQLPLPAPAEYAAIDVSVQADNGPPEHSKISLAGGTFGNHA